LTSKTIGYIMRHMNTFEVLTINQWVKPRSPVNINGVDYIGGLLRLTARGGRLSVNLAQSAKSIAQTISCWALTEGGIDLTQDSRGSANILHYSTSAVWLCQYANIDDFAEFEKQLRNQVARQDERDQHDGEDKNYVF